MSLLKAIKAQLGLSNTPANNFTLDASAENGTLKLARGNAGATTQDILTVDASGLVGFPVSKAIETPVKDALNATGSAPVYACRAWVNFDGGWNGGSGGGTVTIRQSGNVSSIGDNGVGEFTINFATAMVDANYAFSGNAESSSDSNTSHNWAMQVNLYGTRVNYITTSQCRIKVTGAVPANILTDSAQIHCAIFR